MIESTKRTFVIGLLVFLCFMCAMMMIKISNVETDMLSFKEKVRFLQEDMQMLSSTHLYGEDD